MVSGCGPLVYVAARMRHAQVASHAQKYFLRLTLVQHSSRRKASRTSIHDMTTCSLGLQV